MRWQVIAFAGVIAALVAVSWRSLRRPRSHGFPRFFAWLAMAALFFLNVGSWWVDPLAWHQLVSWVLLCASLIPGGWGVLLLLRYGKSTPERRAADPALFAFEATSQLVTCGIFRYIRHPLFSSLILLTWGIFFKQPSIAGGLLASASSGLLFWAALVDEAECRVSFGEEYESYMRRTKRFLPYVL